MALAPSNTFAAVRRHPRPRLRLVQAPRLSVVIVNYHQWDNTTALVKQLTASKALRRQSGEVLVVDNHSPAHPAAQKLRRCPGVSLRRWGRNRGFARAVNEGCRLSRGDWVLLLNPDMSLPDGFLDRVEELAEKIALAEPKAGIIGLGLRNGDGSVQLSVGSFPTLLGTLARLLLPRDRRKYRALQPAERCRVDWITGCCMLIRRECLEDLKGLDGDFFLYYEDVDLCRRARDRGWSVWYEPNLQAVHHNPLHRRSVPSALRVVTRHSLLTYAHKHWPRWQFRLLTGLVGAEARLRWFGARLCGDRQRARLMTRLACITRDLRRGDTARARRRIQQLARHECFYDE